MGISQEDMTDVANAYGQNWEKALMSEIRKGSKAMVKNLVANSRQRQRPQNRQPNMPQRRPQQRPHAHFQDFQQPQSNFRGQRDPNTGRPMLNENSSPQDIEEAMKEIGL
jgi:hypothetical protein